MKQIDKLRECFFDDHKMLVVIMLNTITMFLGGFFTESPLIGLCDAFFTMVFIFEAAAKISVLGWRGYWSVSWNKFDFIVLIVALPTLVSPFLEQSMATSAILALRSMRLLKALKMFQFIPNVGSLLNGVRLAIQSSFLVLIVFLLLLVIFSILSSTIFGGIVPEYFANPLISLYSLFRLFTIEGWYEIPEVIAAKSSVAWSIFARSYFSILVFCGGIIGMSLINSIFVDAMAGDNNDEVLEKLNKIEQQLEDLERKIQENR